MEIKSKTSLTIMLKMVGCLDLRRIDYFYSEIMGFENYSKELEESLSIYAENAKKGMLEAEEIKGVIDFIRNIGKKRQYLCYFWKR